MTPRQQKFVQEYLIDLNAKQAAIRAGYSPKTAQEQASRLLSNVKVQNAIAAFMDNMAASNIADIQEIMEHLTAVMRGEATEEVLMFVGNGVQQITTKQVSEKERLKAAELIGKRYGLFSEKMNIDGLVPVVIVGDDQLKD